MNTLNSETQPVITQNETTYFILCNEHEKNRKYGIMATADHDKSDCAIVQNLFFTKDEAESYCRFLSNNEVYPCSLGEVLANIFIF